MKNFNSLVDVVNNIDPIYKEFDVNLTDSKVDIGCLNKTRKTFKRRLQGSYHFLISVKSYYNFLTIFQKKVKKEYSSNLQREFNRNTENILFILCTFEKNLSLDNIQKLQDEFRKIFHKFFIQSIILKRFLTKPRGYPGDYFMFEMIYDQKPLSEGFGRYFDVFILSRNLAKGMVSRKNLMKSVVRKNLENSQKTINVTNLGCGAARELREFFSENSFSMNANICLVDQDSQGLRYADRAFKKLNLKGIEISFLKREIIGILGFVSKNQKLFKQQDLIYTLGLIDYFLDDAFYKFIKYWLSFLKPNGSLVVALCNSDYIGEYTLLTWFCDWHFLKRNSEQTKNFLKKNFSDFKIRIKWEKTKRVFFVVITKK